MQIYLLSIRQILQSGLRVKGDKSGSTFHNKSGNAVLLATLNLCSNIQIIRTHILKYNVFNLVSLKTRYLDFKTLHHHFGHASYKIICYILNNIEDAKKYFPIQKCICCSYTLGKMYQCSFSENPTCSSKSLGLIHSDLLKLPTLSYLKYKWIITFLDDHFSFTILLFCEKSLRLQIQFIF